MKCPECGSTVREEDKLCPNCGYALEKRISPIKLVEVRARIRLERIRSYRRWGLFCIFFGVASLMLGFYTIDMIRLMAFGVRDLSPDIHWFLVIIGIFLCAIGYYLRSKAENLEKRLIKWTIPSGEEYKPL